MKAAPTNQSIEPRWPVALTIVVVLVLLTVLPDRVRLVPVWVPGLLGMTVLGSLSLVPLSGGKVRWAKPSRRLSRRVERWVLGLFCLTVGVATLVSLAYLIDDMINHSTELDGLQLLTSSIAVWIDNVLLFSLLYWQVDRGGPEARVQHATPRRDWGFPQDDIDTADFAHWHPTFVDYLFLAYTTATAFSPTDALPLTVRAKLLMMLESSISLATILVVVSRAINILGS
ncbi:hypothetical protein PGN35_029150 [Nodosilinea sp. PGN35]|uniref:hypothetical protein n=1 Tax=Nodosilinea sp. PGN35 TaxID=3020489 RepID=UPI0023B2DE7E|nr:hypothetical protein [Nodosilinea sp. TSF1-S3]MDF0368258.1 hypothetical protein [Nodosilinea sp. TSF1-S3]